MSENNSKHVKYSTMGRIADIDYIHVFHIGSNFYVDFYIYFTNLNKTAVVIN